MLTYFTNRKKMMAYLVLLTFVFACIVPANVALAEEDAVYSAEKLVKKSAERIDDPTNQYRVKLEVPGEDGTELHDEVILMVDGSYSGDDEWNSMVDTITTIGATVLNGTGNTQLTLMAFGMGDNIVLSHAKDAEELSATLGALPGSLLYGRSSTNCEAGFTGVAEYIVNHDSTLNDVHVLYISDGEVNTDETPANFYDWKNNGWHRFAEDMIITANFEAECAAIAQGANRSNAFETVFYGDYATTSSAITIDGISTDTIKLTPQTSPSQYQMYADWDIRTVDENTAVEDIYGLVYYELVDEYNAQIWADVYAEAGLNPDGEYPVSDVERAFVDYDNAHNTYIQDNFYYALVGRGYPDKTARTIAAAEALEGMNQVESMYILDSNRTTAWMQAVGGENFIPAGSVANLIPSLKGVLTDLSKTPFNDVVVTDYMSKWVNLDPTSIAIVDDMAGATIWTAADGWLIDNNRPTAEEIPVVVEFVEPADYAAGGPDVEGNTTGSIYKLTWKVKDGALLRSEKYHLEYNVVVDTLEEGFEYRVFYPANGTTTVEFVDENNTPNVRDIEVPDVFAKEDPTEPTPPSYDPTPIEYDPEPTPPPTEPEIPDTLIPDEETPLADMELDDPEVPLADMEEPEIPLGDAPATGDNTNTMGYVGMMLAALAGLFVTRRRFN